MKKSLFILLPLIAVLVGCSDKLPNCANEETTKLVKNIYWDTVADQLTVLRKNGDLIKRSLPQDVEALKKVVSFNLASIEEVANKNKDKFTCKARVTLIPSPEGKSLMNFVEKGGDASDAALMIILLGAGKDYTDQANRKSNFSVELFDQAAKMLLAAPLFSEALAGGNTATSAFTPNLVGVVIGGAVGAYAGTEVGPQNVQLLASAMEDIGSLETKNGSYVAEVQFSSSIKKVDNRDRHFVEAQFSEKGIIFPIDLYIIGDKFKKGNERLLRVAEQVADAKKKQDAPPVPVTTNTSPIARSESTTPTIESFQPPVPQSSPASNTVPQLAPVTPAELMPKTKPVSPAPSASTSAPIASKQVDTAASKVSSLGRIDGSWYSAQWKYGYNLKDGVGIATSSNSSKFKPGDKIINLTGTGENTFQGEQIYTDGNFYKITATLLPDGALSFVGEKNAKWIMTKIR